MLVVVSGSGCSQSELDLGILEIIGITPGSSILTWLIFDGKGTNVSSATLFS